MGDTRMEFGDLHNRGIANVGDFRGARLYNFVPPLPPKPGRRYLVPRGARRQFAGYSDILQRLERRLLHNGDDDDNSKQTVFVLSGLGGVGKSEIVLQFAEKHRDRFWGIFWIDCGSDASALAGFRTVAEECSWPAQGSHLINEVKMHLMNTNHRFLLVLDNCDDGHVDYEKYVPGGKRVCVIVTTRRSDCDQLASWDDRRVRDYERLEGIDPESAVALVKASLGITSNESKTIAARRMVETLGCHPLAIIMALSFVRSGRSSLEEYPGMFDKRHVQLLHEPSTQMRSRYENVYTTFEVSAQALQTDPRPSAKLALSLLQVLAFMDRQEISEDMFTRAWAHENRVQQKNDDDGDMLRLSKAEVSKSRSFIHAATGIERLILLREARAELDRLSLAASSSDLSSMYIHPLIHAWARSRIDPQLRGRAWATTASILALSTQGSQIYTDYTMPLQLHLETCFATGKQDGEADCVELEKCRIWWAFAWRLYHARSSQAVKIAWQLLQMFSKMTNVHDHAEQLLNVQKLAAYCLLDTGKVREAQELLERVVEIRERTLPPEHPNRLASQHDLASAYLANGRAREAPQLLERVVEIQERTLPPEHPDRLISQQSLGAVRQANILSGKNIKTGWRAKITHAFRKE